jgi:hypothetical protein
MIFSCYLPFRKKKVDETTRYARPFVVPFNSKGHPGKRATCAAIVVRMRRILGRDLISFLVEEVRQEKNAKAKRDVASSHYEPGWVRHVRFVICVCSCEAVLRCVLSFFCRVLCGLRSCVPRCFPRWRKAGRSQNARSHANTRNAGRVTRGFLCFFSRDARQRDSQSVLCYECDFSLFEYSVDFL